MLATSLLAIALLSTPKPLSLDELVRRHTAAKGGEKKLAALQSLRLTGKIVFRDGDSPIELAYGELLGRPGRIREEVTMQGLTAVDAYDGSEAWTIDPFQGRRDPQRDSADDARERAQQADFEGPLVHWKEKGHRVELLGTEDVDGTAALKVRVSLKDGDTVYVYLDPDRFLEIREVWERHVRGAERIREVDLGDYGEVAGVFVPFSISAGPKGKKRTMEVTFDRAEANVEPPDALFHFPKAGSAAVRAIVAATSAKANGTEAPSSKHTPTVLDSGAISGLGARNIGSAEMSGRISAIAGLNDEGETTLYVGAASGGVWKSNDGATTFKPIFDREPVQSIGAIAIDPSHPKTVWVGTGESWTRNSVSIGDGIYRSDDGGESWTNMGLPQSERITRIIVHPSDGNVVYACVPGKLWSDSADRGLYKTTDGGKSWRLVLRGPNLSTGCSSVAMDPVHPEILFAGLWDFRRKGWTFRSGGEGPEAASGSGLFRSTDAGETWVELTPEKNLGIPAKPWGRVEVTVAPSDSKVVYALLESKSSALFRSADGGRSWEKRDDSQMMIWRPFYFARLIVDPKNPNRIFKPDLQLVVSEDGGRSFSGAGGGAHGDWHDLWIDPSNPKHIVGGDDGGLWTSWDGASRWWKSANLPVSQFYHVAIDDKDPYQVYGGLQDNSSWVGESAYPGGISNSRWENLFGGDGFWTVPDPSDPDAVYAEAQGGYIGRVDRKTHVARDIQPKAGYHEKLRFNWNTPIQVSPTDPKTLYLGAQFLFRSRDRGDSWERISPDLTTNEPAKQKQEESGGVTVDNSSAEMHTTIYSISESRFDAKTIWAGTDDGNLQLTRDGGAHWVNVAPNVPGLPAASWVSWVEASRFDPGSAYAAFDRHTFGDLAPWVFETHDYGRHWSRIVGPEQGVRGYAHVIREDTQDRDLLFLGTELGLWISVDGGKHWAQFKGNGFPSVAVRDLAVQPRDGDLVVATHGRGLWIVDDISTLRHLGGDLLSKDVAFVDGRPVQDRLAGQGGWVEGDAAFVGENPTGGAAITYYLKARHLFGPLTLEVFDPAGRLVDTLSATKRRGLNRVEWSMLLKPPRVPKAASVAFNSSQGPRVLPGRYRLRLTEGKHLAEAHLEVGLDRRATFTVADRKEQFDAVMRVQALFSDMTDLLEKIESAKGAAVAKAGSLPVAAALGQRLRAASEKLDGLRKKIVATKEGGAITGEERLREHTDFLYGALQSWEGRPASYQVQRIDTLRQELTVISREFEAESKTLAELDDAWRRQGLPAVVVERSPEGLEDAHVAIECWRGLKCPAAETRTAERD